VVSKPIKGILAAAFIAGCGLVFFFFNAAGLMLVIFVSMLVAIAKSKYDRMLVAMAAGTITFFVVFFTFAFKPGGTDVSAYDEFARGLIGSPADNFVNLRSIMLIAGMMIIIQICIMGGVFQVFAFSLIKLTKGNGYAMMVVFSFLAVFTTAVFNDILTVILLVPLTIEVCKILDVNPKTYVLLEAIMIKVGATFFSISSIANILITGYFKVSFSEFFVNIGVYSIFTFVVTIFFFLGTYSGKLEPAKVGVDILLEYKASSFIPDKKLTTKCVVVLVGVLTLFTLNIPNLPADVVTISAAGLLLFWSRLETKEVMHRVDFKLLVYLFGIFIVTGGMEATGLIAFIKTAVSNINITNPIFLVLFALGVSAGLSAFIDNVPITRVLIPIIAALIPDGSPNSAFKMPVLCMLVFGLNVGDNLTPFGDTLMTFNVAEQHKLILKPGEFFNIAFKTTMFQYASLLVLFILQIDLVLGLWILLAYVVGIVVVVRAFKVKMPFTFKNALLFVRSLFRRNKKQP
jgi:Na+/H+ antiporter NhaD/arsenite permease-like protein